MKSATSIRDRRLTAAGIATIVLLTAACYWPALHGDFILDDDVLLTQSPVIHAGNGLYRIWFTTEPFDYWPVTNTSLWIEWRLWGLNSTGYHITNLALHIADSLLIWMLLRKLAVPGAFLAALLFAIHPVNVESVAWISQRKNLLALLFFLIAALCYLKSMVELPGSKKETSVGRFTIWYWLSLLTFTLSMLSKGSMAVFPLVLLLLIWWQRGRIESSDVVRTGPFFVVAGLLVVLNIWFQNHGNSTNVLRHASALERLLGAGGVVWFYLAKAIAPIDLMFIYPQWKISASNLLWWLPLLATVSVTGVLWLKRNTRFGRPLLLAWSFYCIALLPVMGFADVGFMRYSLVADHYQHLALIGVVALAGASFGWWQQRSSGQTRVLAVTGAISLVSVFSLLTWQQSDLYASPAALYQASLKNDPNCWLAANMLGRIESEALHSDNAIEYYEKALRSNPDYTDAHYNLARELVDKAVNQQNRDPLPSAISHYEEAIRLGPDSANLHNNYAMALDLAGRKIESLAQLVEAVQLEPNHLPTNYNLVNCLARNGKLKEALVVAEHGLSVAKADNDGEMMKRFEAQLRALHEALSPEQ